MIDYEALEQGNSLGIALRGEDGSLELYGIIFRADDTRLQAKYAILRVDFAHCDVHDALNVNCQVGLAVDEEALRKGVAELDMPEDGWLPGDITLAESDEDAYRIEMGSKIAGNALIAVFRDTTTLGPGEQN